MNGFVRPCQPAELPFVIESIDREFIFSKGRSISLSGRFPNVLSDHNIEHVLVAEADHAICGAAGIRTFVYATEQRLWRGAMLGMVWVDPQYRGHGIGRELMTAAERLLRAEGLDFGVLWTGIPAFYERRGWLLNDISAFSEIRGSSPVLHKGEVHCRPLASEDAGRLESVRSSLEARRVLRGALDYQVIPVPAVAVHCFWATANEGDGYALVGEADGVGFFYEMIAPPVLWDLLWSAITGRFKRIFINGRSEDPFAIWLAEEKNVKWECQDKTMWLPISRFSADAPLNTWHIPYFDRI